MRKDHKKSICQIKALMGSNLRTLRMKETDFLAEGKLQQGNHLGNTIIQVRNNGLRQCDRKTECKGQFL